MPAFKITFVGLLCYFASLALGSKCPQDATSKLVVCYYKGDISLTNFNICNCTHVVFTNAIKRAENNSITPTEDAIKYLNVIKERKENISAIFTLETKEGDSSTILKLENRTKELINAVVEFLQESQFDGVELNFKFNADDGVSKESFASFVKKLSKTLSHHRRVKREGYDVFEKVQDDVTTAAYTTQSPKNSTSKTQSIKQRSEKRKESKRKVREQKKEEEDYTDYLTLEEAINVEFSKEKTESQVTLKDVDENVVEEKFLIFVRLSIKPEIIAKKYDLKALSRYADVLSVPTHNIVSSNEERLTYHPSRLMGLSDILNTDSVLDFLTGMGAQKSKIVISMPATVLKFQLKDENENTPRSPSGLKPQVIDQSQLCALFSKNNWTIERDDDLTAPYAFSGKTWLAFEDEISINIKGKYILLRELAGGAIYPIDSDLNDSACKNRTGSGGYLTGILHKNFERLERKPRALVLESLQDEIHENAFIKAEAGVKLSEYRIVRVVDHSGAVHIIRKNTKTQFECSRQGYFSHPLGCNKFYRCVKFDQYSDEFTVFEYDCPAGLAFDERWEVCVWPGSLPHGAPCTGSSEIAPVPRSHYQCPNHEGYYADPENCRWFFACLDHARDGITPLTAYEFRCPFGLVFSEAKLACDWPWLVGGCGNRGAAGYLQVSAAGQSQGIRTATFINGGNLEASFGQYGKTDEEDSFIGFGKKFGSGLKASGGFNAEAPYQGAQSAGFGYIAGQFDDQHDRASFAAFPDYEISGGRILNKGGVVLDQNIVGISGVPTGGVVGAGSASVLRTGVTGSIFGGRGPGSTGDDSGAGHIVGSGGTQTVLSAGRAGSIFSTGGVGNIVSAGARGVGSAVSAGEAGNIVGLGGSQTVVGVGRSGSILGTGGVVQIVGAGGGGGVVGSGGAGNIVGSVGTGHIAGSGGSQTVVGVGTSGGILGSGGAGNIVGSVGTGHIAGSGGSQTVVGVGTSGGILGSGGAGNVGAGGVGHIAGAGGSGGVVGTGGAGNIFGDAGHVDHVIGTGSIESVVDIGKTGSIIGIGDTGSPVTAGGVSDASLDVTGGFGSRSRGFGKSSGYFQSVSTPSIRFEKPTLKTSKTNIVGVSGEQASLENSISTPKPFSVDIPSVQINEEKISQFSKHSIIGSSTPQIDNNQSSGQGFSISHGLTATHPTVPVGIPAVTPTTEIYAFGKIPSEGFGGSHLKTDISVAHVSAPPKSEVQFRQNEFASGITVGVPAVTGTSFGYSSTASGGTTPTVSVSASLPTVTPKPRIQTFEYTASHDVGIGSSLPTENPFVSFTQQNYKVTDHSSARKISGKAFPAIQTDAFKTINGGQNFISGNIGQAGVSFGAPGVRVTPSAYSGVKTGRESAIHLSGVTPGPTVTDFVHSTIDERVTNELKYSKPQTSFGAPAVTPKTEFHAFSKASTGQLNFNSHIVSSNIPLVTPKSDHQIFSQTDVTGKSQSTVSFGVPTVTPQPDLNAFKYYEGSVSVTPIAPFESTATAKNNFEQTGTVKEVPKVSFNIPASIRFEKIDTFQKKGISQGVKASYGVPFVPSGLETDTVVQTGVSHPPGVGAPVQPAFGQRYSSFKQTGNNFGQVQPFDSAPKVEQKNILTEVSIEQQPIVSVGTFTATNNDKTLSTPRTYSSAQKVFSQGSAVNNINFKSTYVQPQPVTLTTPTPIVSITPFTPTTTHSLNLNAVAKSPQTITYKQEERINVGTAAPTTTVNVPGAVIFNEKSSTFGQEIKSFTPVVQVSTPVPLTYKEEVSSGFGTRSFYEKAYLSPVTPKAEVFGSAIQHGSQGSAVQFGINGGNQLSIQPKQSAVNQQIEFTKTKPLIEEKRTEYIQHQVPVQISTAAPAYQQGVKIEQPVVTTEKRFEPREQLLELEISKSVELNPSQFAQSNGYVSQNIPTQVEIQKQPVHLISQKAFKAKQVIQPFYTQQKEIVQPQINNAKEDGYFEQFAFQHPVNIKTPKPQKQYLPATTRPPVSYSTAKTVNVAQPVAFSGGPALPAFESSKVPFTSQKETVIYNTNVYQPSIVEHKPSKVNLLLPTVTEASQFTPSQTEELTIQTHSNFDSQRTNKFGTTPAQNIFIQSTLKPAVKIYESVQYAAENFTSGQSSFGSGIKYSVNPNIAIPEPPREYFAQNTYTTSAPERVTTGSRFASTGSATSGYKSSTYHPPSRQKSSKTTVLSVGNLDGVGEDNIQQLFNGYSGRFGQVVNDRNEKLSTKVVKGEGRETIEVDRQGLSTVQYEVSSTTPKPRGRGRQYHGGITSGIQATNKYEEYEINGDGQRSFDAGSTHDGSKTTIDLKNLKLDKNKKTVIVVSQVSDANPVLVGKLAGQCSCQSNMLHLRSKSKTSKGSLKEKSQQRPSFITNEYLPPFESNQGNSAGESLTGGEASTASPETVVIDGSKSSRNGISYASEQTLVSSTTALPETVPSTILSSLGPDGVLSITPKPAYTEERRNKKIQFRGKTRYLPPVSSLSVDGLPLLSPVPASEIAGYTVLKGDESRTQNEIDAGKYGGVTKARAGAAFERYGPGGWRSFDETLQGSIDCKRPGLFRHPRYCNKFYACNYDPWEERYTLHIFNCPIHLTYDSSISACNWPVRGPACADDNLLV